MSKRGKGLKNERRADRCYESAGMWTYRPENASYGDNDLWNLFDVAALDPRQCKLYFIQVKSNRATGINQWFHDTRPFSAVSGVAVHYVVRHDHEGWRLAERTSDGYSWVVDERHDDRIGVNRHTELGLGDGLTEYLRGES